MYIRGSHSNDEIIEICRTSTSMLEAANKLSIPYTTFKRIVVALGVWKTNQGGKGVQSPTRVKLEDMLANKAPAQSYLLKNRLIEAGIKTWHCEMCLKTKWNKKKISLELHHIDGNGLNNNLSNIQLLCPNCHSQTPNWKRRKADR